eukprot:5288252-Pleurochrysis_carterae.AAC.1
MAQEFSFRSCTSRARLTDCDSPPLRRMWDNSDEECGQENFHFASGVRVEGDQGVRLDGEHRRVRRPLIAREGMAWEGVFVPADEMNMRTPK